MSGLILLKSIIIIIGLALLIIFVMSGFLTGNFNIGNYTGIGISLVLLVYGIFAKEINRMIESVWRYLAGKILLIIIMIIIGTILVLAGACSAAMISGVSKKAESGRTVVVLGAKIKENRVSKTLARRLDAAYQYLIDNPESFCIVSGGQGDDEICSEASLMYEYLLNKGIAEARIYVEDRSKDTDENLDFSKEIIEQMQLNPEIVLATDGYHEYRAMTYSKRKGMDAQPIPCGTTWWLWPASIIREMYGILEMWILK